MKAAQDYLQSAEFCQSALFHTYTMAGRPSYLLCHINCEQFPQCDVAAIEEALNIAVTAAMKPFIEKYLEAARQSME